MEEEGAQGKQELPSDPLRPLLSPHPDGREDVLRLLGQPLDRKEHGLRTALERGGQLSTQPTSLGLVSLWQC